MRPSPRPSAVAGAGAAVLVLAVAASAAGGSWTLEERHYGSFNFRIGGDPPTLPPRPTPSPGSDEAGGGSGGLLGLDGRWLLALLAVLAAVGAGVVLRRLWLRFRATAAPPEAAQVHGAGAMAAGDAEPELPPLLAAAQAALSALSVRGASADAVVAAWLAVEEGAARSGVQRRRAQTATEFTVAVLRRTSADPNAIATLRGLYLRARFSEQPATEADIAEAASCVRTLAAGWAEAGIDAPPTAPAPTAARPSDGAGR